jgi:predicted alpha-1,6-mannanase (GH76 family)
MLPIAVWKEMMNHYFPDAAWLRLRRDVFDQLYAFRARRALPTWEAALEALLETQRAP